MGLGLGHGITISSSALGKYKTTVQMVTVILLLLGPAYLSEYFMIGEIFVGEVGLWVVVVLSLVSAAQYFLDFWKQLGPSGKPT